MPLGGSASTLVAYQYQEVNLDDDESDEGDLANTASLLSFVDVVAAALSSLSLTRYESAPPFRPPHPVLLCTETFFTSLVSMPSSGLSVGSFVVFPRL